MSPSPRQPPPAWVLPVWICFSGRPHNWDDTVSVLQFLASRTRRDVSSAHACWSVCQYVIHWWSWGTFHFLCSPHCIRPLFRGWAFEWLPLFVCFVYVLLSIPTQILCANMGFNSHIRMAGWYARGTFNLLRNSQTVSKTPAPFTIPSASLRAQFLHVLTCACSHPPYWLQPCQHTWTDSALAFGLAVLID